MFSSIKGVRLMAWIRPVAVALALALGGGCEQGGGAAPAGGKGAVVAGPAGEVVHLDGEATAARPGEAPRALAVGDAVHADDTIAVATTGELSIMIAHNKVRWDIGGGQSYRVDQSRAWTAKAGSGSALDEQGELGTASAGRHGEREAGETQATVQDEAEPESRPEMKAETASREMAVAPATSQPKPPADAVRRREPAAEPAPGPSGGEALRGKALGMSPADEIAVAPRASQPRQPMTVALGEIKVGGARAAADVARGFAGFSADACGVSETGAVVLRLEITGDGRVLKPRITGPAALVAQVKGCVTAAARKLRFPEGVSGHTQVEREIRFSAKSKSK
jgi:hypothetical protein